MKLLQAVQKLDAELKPSLAEAGAGCIGDYRFCSFVTKGEGSFQPMKGARPVKGKVGRVEHCPEDRLEMVVPANCCGRAVEALRRAHPYEEPAFDLVPLENRDNRLGYGCIGELKRPVLSALQKRVERSLGRKVEILYGALEIRRMV
jgi:hypothetical protein